VEIRVAILTVSDRSFRGERPDLSGPALAEVVRQNGWHLAMTEIVPDEQPAIEQVLIQWSDQGQVDLILTTGGTGFAPRDVTPEATLKVVHRLAPGFAEYMRIESLRITPNAVLSRAAAGIRGQTLIVNLPGSPKGAVENLNSILPVLPHAVQLLKDDPSAEAGHH
jgi:molybdopterin adenylyltransferase